MVMLLLACTQQAVEAPEPDIQLTPIEPVEAPKPAPFEAPVMVFTVQQWHIDPEAQEPLEEALDAKVVALQGVLLTACKDCAVVRKRTRYTTWPAGLHGQTELQVTLMAVEQGHEVIRAAEGVGAVLARARLAY